MSTNRILIFDTTLRDGEQVPGCKLNKKEKMEIALQLEDLGVDIMEVGFPASSPGDFDSVSAIARLVKEATVCALSRAVSSDIAQAAQALKGAARPRIHTGIGTSDFHIQYKFKSNQEEIIQRAIGCVKEARNYCDDVEFYAEDAGRTDNEYLARVVEAVIAAGATTVNIPDTTGYCLPEQYYTKISYLKNHVPNIDKAVLSAHCHNDLGLATANTLAGIEAGIRQVECTINGIGERAGNAALEEIVMILKQHSTLNVSTKIKTENLCTVSHLVKELTGMNVQANKAIVGANAFAHSSGIHQDGFLKNAITYEIIKPEEVGACGSKIVLTARSGRAALMYKMHQLGMHVQAQNVDEVYQLFLQKADRAKEVGEADLKAIYQQVILNAV